MFNSIKTRWLVGIFAVLAILTAIAVITNNSKSTVSRNRTFKSELTDFDTTKVTQIIVYPKMKEEQIILSKSGDNWKVTDGNKKYKADENTIKSILTTLITLRATRIAANDKSQWDEYEVTDSAASRVQLLAGKKIVCDLYLGKFSYQQPKNTNPYSYSQQGKMTSYVRPADDKKVYAVDGLLAMSFNRQASDFRDHSIVRSDKESWNRLSFNGPGKTYSLIKQGNNWSIDGIVADSITVANYVSSLAWLSSQYFADESGMYSDKPVNTLTIEGESLSSPIKVFAFEADTTNKYLISSSLNEGAYFSGKMNGLFEKIFVSREYFFPLRDTEETGTKANRREQ